MCNLHTVYSGFFGRISDMPRQRKKIETWLRCSHVTHCVHYGGTRVVIKAKSRLVLSKFSKYLTIDEMFCICRLRINIVSQEEYEAEKRGTHVTRNPILTSTTPSIHPCTLNPLTCLLCLNRLSINSTAATEYRLLAPKFPSSTLAIGDRGVIP
jgi:hypothetical protein